MTIAPIFDRKSLALDDLGLLNPKIASVTVKGKEPEVYTPDKLDKYSSSVETLNKAGVARRNANKEKTYTEAVFGDPYTNGYKQVGDEYADREERREHNNSVRDKYNEEHGTDFKDNSEIAAANEKIREENKERIANGEEPLEEYPYMEDLWAGEEEYRALDIFPAATSEKSAIAQQIAADVLIGGQKVGAWVDFWEAIDKRFPQIMTALDSIKEKLLAAIDALEYLIDGLKQLIDILSAVVGTALQMASLAILLAKSVIASLRLVLSQLLKLLQFALLKSDIKLTTFNLFEKVITPSSNGNFRLASNIDRMAPFVQSTFKEMAETRFNRPTAENELCFAMLIPCALSAETATMHGKICRLIDLFSISNADEWRDSQLLRSKVALKYDPYTGGALRAAVDQMTKDFGWDTTLPYTTTQRKIVAEAVGVCEDMLPSVTQSISTLAEKLGKAYDELDKAEKQGIKSEAASIPENRLPGIVHQILAREEESGKKVFVEINFATRRSHWISSIYRIRENENPERIFFDPSFVFAQAITDSGLREYINDTIQLFRSALEWWRSRRSSDPTAEERNFKNALDKFFFDLLGDDTFAVYANGYPVILISDSLLFTLMLKNILSKSNGKFDSAITAYDNKDKKQPLEYKARASINPAIPRVKPQLTLTNVDVSEDDTLVFVMISDQGKYYPHDFIKNGGDRDAKYYSSMTPGDLVVNLDTKKVKTKVLKQGADLIKPRWYGIGTPAGVNDINLSWILNQFNIGEYIGMPLQVLASLDKYLDIGTDYISAFKEMFDNWVGVFNRYYCTIKDVIDAMRKMLLAFGLPNLPSIYVVTWQGGIKDLPSILMSALQEINIDNSTYAGVVLFGSQAASAEFIEMYNTHKVTKAEIDKAKNQAKNWWAEENNLASDISTQASKISHIDWIGLNAYNKRIEAEQVDILEKARKAAEEALTKYTEEQEKLKEERLNRTWEKVKEIADGVFIVNVIPAEPTAKKENMETATYFDDRVVPIGEDDGSTTG